MLLSIFIAGIPSLGFAEPGETTAKEEQSSVPKNLGGIQGPEKMAPSDKPDWKSEPKGSSISPETMGESKVPGDEWKPDSKSGHDVPVSRWGNRAPNKTTQEDQPNTSSDPGKSGLIERGTIRTPDKNN
jgi:hypothetical protein